MPHTKPCSVPGLPAASQPPTRRYSTLLCRCLGPRTLSRLCHWRLKHSGQASPVPSSISKAGDVATSQNLYPQRSNEETCTMTERRETLLPFTQTGSGANTLVFIHGFPDDSSFC